MLGGDAQYPVWQPAQSCSCNTFCYHYEVVPGFVEIEVAASRSPVVEQG